MNLPLTSPEATEGMLSGSPDSKRGRGSTVRKKALTSSAKKEHPTPETPVQLEDIRLRCAVTRPPSVFVCVLCVFVCVCVCVCVVGFAAA